MSLIEIKDLVIAYGKGQTKQAVGPVELNIQKGEAMGLVGESGAGKSTLGLAVLDALALKGGKIVQGQIHRKIPIKNISYIPQDPLSSLDPLFSVGSQLLEMNSDKKAVKVALNDVSLPLDRMDLRSYPHELSGGMRQRLMVAMALLKSPALIVADEPTSSLDASLCVEIIDLFKKIQKTGVAFLFLTHNLPLAKSFCDRVAVMKEGLIVESGAPRDVFGTPKNQYTRNLVNSVPVLIR